VHCLCYNYYMYASYRITKRSSWAVKKVCSPQENPWEKRCEIQGGGQEMAVMGSYVMVKILIKTIQVNLVLWWFGTELLLLNFLLSQPFLGRHLWISHAFSQSPSSGTHTFFTAHEKHIHKIVLWYIANLARISCSVQSKVAALSMKQIFLYWVHNWSILHLSTIHQ